MIKLNKVSKAIKLAVPITAFSGTAFAASIDHIQHYNVGYTGNPAQNGVISEDTSALYNLSLDRISAIN